MNNGKYTYRDTTIKADVVKIDDERHEVTVYGKIMRLTPKEYMLLTTLAKANGRVIGRDTLQSIIWGTTSDVIDTRTVDQHVARLRAKLGKAATIIGTVSNFGYQITSGVKFIVNNTPTTYKAKIETIERAFGKKPGAFVRVFIPGSTAETLTEKQTVEINTLVAA